MFSREKDELDFIYYLIRHKDTAGGGVGEGVRDTAAVAYHIEAVVAGLEVLV